MRASLLLLLGVVSGIGGTVGVTAEDAFKLSCMSIASDTSAAGLVARFGASNVVAGQVYLGEGEYEPGTILFAGIPERRAEIAWKQKAAQRAPSFVRIRGEKSQWSTPQGLTLGLDLTRVERLNRRPFRLRGFGWDYGGTTTSWSGGVLAQAELPQCAVWARFANEEDRLTAEELKLSRQVEGEPEFSSGHPGMQAAHARVREFGLAWQE